MRVDVYQIIKNYINLVERLDDKVAKDNFPALDDDTLADAIAEYLGDKYSLNLFHETYDEVAKTFKIFG